MRDQQSVPGCTYVHLTPSLVAVAADVAWNVMADDDRVCGAVFKVALMDRDTASRT